MPMKNPPHPGLSVRHDCLEPLGLSVTEAARRLGVSRTQLSDVVNCRSGISPEMAIRLDKAFGGGADTWHLAPAPIDVGTGPGIEEGRPDQGRASVACGLTPREFVKDSPVADVDYDHSARADPSGLRAPPLAEYA